MGWDIPVEPEVEKQLQGHPLVLRVIQERGRAFCERDGQLFIQSNKELKACGFLEPDKLCSIHKELGFQAKPATCQLFPFVVTHTPEGYFVGTTYYCSATRQNHGRPTSEHQQDLLEQLERGAPINQVADDGLVLYNRYYASYAQYRQLESELRQRGPLSAALQEAAAGLAQLMSEQPYLEEEIVALGDRLGEVWQRASKVSPAHLELISMLQICDYFKFSMERELWDQVEAGVLDGQYFALPEFDWSGTTQQLRQLCDGRFDEQIGRYLEHLVFRQALVVHPPLLASLMQLAVLPDFLRIRTGLLAHRAGREITQEDYFEALQEAETYLVTHGRSRRIIHQLAADELIRLLR